VFVENGFVETFRAAGNEDAGDAYTFHAFKSRWFKPSDTDKPVGRIDWILVKGNARVGPHEILRDGDEKTGRYPSDHYPVLAELSLSG
jgi:endonuclease/exonuclease/phosphatase family metal-dependent hydrolase